MAGGAFEVRGGDVTYVDQGPFKPLRLRNHPTFRGNVDLANIELDYFKPITNRYNLLVDKGVLSASGAVEYGQAVKTVELNQATIEGIHVDYVHTARTDVAERQRAGQAAAVAKDVSNKPGVLVRIVELRPVKSTVGYVNKAAATPYHVFLTDVDGMLKNLSNHEVEGAAASLSRRRPSGRKSRGPPSTSRYASKRSAFRP
jgi:hypothetical protein